MKRAAKTIRRTAFVLLPVTVLFYIISYFLNMHAILNINRDIEDLDYTFEAITEGYKMLSQENSILSSRAVISKIAEDSLDMFIADDFKDYAFYKQKPTEEEESELILMQILSPSAAAMITKPPIPLH